VRGCKDREKIQAPSLRKTNKKKKREGARRGHGENRGVQGGKEKTFHTCKGDRTRGGRTTSTKRPESWNTLRLRDDTFLEYSLVNQIGCYALGEPRKGSGWVTFPKQAVKKAEEGISQEKHSNDLESSPIQKRCRGKAKV